MPQKIPNAGFGNFDVVLVREGVDFANTTSSFIWNENSPLPPGMRYVELADMYVVVLQNPASFPILNNFLIAGLDESVLPKDSLGNIRRNLRPCGVDVTAYNSQTLDIIPTSAEIAAELAAIYAEDTMWTGEVVDPLNWQDDFWDALLINKERMKIYLDAHPGCSLLA